MLSSAGTRGSAGWSVTAGATLVALALLMAAGAAAATPRATGPAGSFATAGPTPTASDEQSKLWFHDGSWWAVLWSEAAGDHHVFRFDAAEKRWVDTGTPVDDRSRTRADVLRDGNRLYVLSHKFSLDPGVDNPTRLYRFTYQPASKTYAPDGGFPVIVNRARPRVVVFDKDSEGRLWATWTKGGRVFLNATVCDPRCDDARWGTPFVPEVANARVTGNDVASLVAFGGNRIGLMWSNQIARRFSFAVHLDGAETTAWEPPEVISGITADDHISLKADATGNVVAAVKTTTRAAADPLNVLLVRSPAGQWKQAVIGLRRDRHTRAVVVVDQQHGLARVFASAPSAGRRSVSAVYAKTASLTDPAFPDGLGTPVMSSPDGSISDSTVAKHPVTRATGLLVLAADATNKQYWFDYTPRLATPATAGGSILGADPPPPTPEAESDPASFEAPGDGWTVLSLALVATTGAILIAALLAVVPVARRRFARTPRGGHTSPMMRRGRPGTDSLPRARRGGYDVDATNRLVERLTAESEAARAAAIELRTETESLRAELDRTRAGDPAVVDAQGEAAQAELRAEIDALRTELEWERSGHATARSRVEAAQASEIELRTTVERLQGELQGRGDDSELRARAEAAQLAQVGLRTEIERLQGELARTAHGGGADEREQLEAAAAREAQLQGEVETLRTELDAARAAGVRSDDARVLEAELRAEIEGLRATLESERLVAADAGARAAAADTTESELRAEIDTLRGELESERTIGAEARARAEMGQSQEAAFATELDQLREDLERERTAGAEVRTRYDEVQGIENELRGEIEALRSQLDEARRATPAATEGPDVDELRERRSELLRDREGLEAEVDALRNYRREIERDRERLVSELEALREHYRELNQEREQRESEIETLRTQNRELTEEHDGLAQRVEALSSQRSELERDHEHLESQLDGLRALTEEAHGRLRDLSTALSALKLDVSGAETVPAERHEPAGHEG
jgi:predicted  nucleic acid-binding Zn-ribbon protein